MTRTRLRLLAAILGVLLVLSPTARAERGETRTRALYAAGSAAFEAGRFDEALARFREAYLADHNPAFLFNMAVCLERLERPRDAADELRAYLRAEPNAPSRAEVESRARGLDEAQRIVDAERLRNATPQLLAPAPLPSRWPRRRVLAVTLGTIGGVAIAVGLGVGLGLGLRPQYPASTLDTQVVTR